MHKPCHKTDDVDANECRNNIVDNCESDGNERVDGFESDGNELINCTNDDNDDIDFHKSADNESINNNIINIIINTVINNIIKYSDGERHCANNDGGNDESKCERNDRHKRGRERNDFEHCCFVDGRDNVDGC